MINKLWQKIDKYYLIVFTYLFLSLGFVKLHPMSESLRILLYIVIIYCSDLVTGFIRTIRYDYENKDWKLSMYEEFKLNLLTGYLYVIPYLKSKDKTKVISEFNVCKEAARSLLIDSRRKDRYGKVSTGKSYTSVSELMEDLTPECKGFEKFLQKYPKLVELRRILWYKLEDHPEDLHCFIRHAFQRIKNGYSTRDCWGFYYFLTCVIISGCEWLLENKHGIPSQCFIKSDPVDENGTHTEEAMELAEKRWDKTLKEIIHTFKTARHMDNDHWFYQNSKTYDVKLANQYRKINKGLKEDNPKLFADTDLHVMTKKECQRYEKGWLLFRDNFHSLWD